MSINDNWVEWVDERMDENMEEISDRWTVEELIDKLGEYPDALPEEKRIELASKILNELASKILAVCQLVDMLADE